MIGTVLGLAFAVGMLALGLATFPFPGWMSRVYGAPVDTAGGHAFVRATGLRDLVLAAAIFALLATGDRWGAAVVCGATGACAVVDFAIVALHRGVREVPLQLLVHLSGIAMGFAAAFALSR